MAMTTATTMMPSGVDARTLRAWLDRGDPVKVLDVRSPAEYEAAHISGAFNVPLDTLDVYRGAIRRVAEPVVLVCRTGQQAAQAAVKLEEAGMPDVHVLQGGLLAWEGAGAPVRRGRQRWDLERQVRLVAGSLVLSGVLASTVFKPAKWLAAGVGAGLIVAALTNTCTMARLLGKLPYNRAANCDVQAVVRQLTAGALN